MADLLTGAQMRAVERAAIESGAATGFGLMERAAEGVLAEALAAWPDLAAGAHRALVLCGPGNNGGDGFAVAWLLRARGWAVEVLFFGAAEKLPPDARANFERWTGTGEVRVLDAAAAARAGACDLVVDAVFGVGLTRPLPADLAEALARAGGDGPVRVRRVAVDCPSGLDLDTGRAPGGSEAPQPAPCDLTVTFHAPKPGHFLGQGPDLCGALRVIDIGLRGTACDRSRAGEAPDPDRARMAEPVTTGPAGFRAPRSAADWPLGGIAKTRGAGGHKFDFGHAMVLAGGVGQGGAARLAARAALRAGAGLVTLLCPPAALIENACHLDAVMLRALPGPEALDDLADARVSAFCLGPGMGTGARTRETVLRVLARRAGGPGGAPPAVVLDADALSVFSDAPEALFAALHPRCVLTPHEGEFARLFPDLGRACRAEMSELDAARAAADRAGCTVLLKGRATVIAAPGGGAALHAACYDRSVPWLATAGAGDVLAGLIAGLAAPAAGPEPFAAAELATWLHVEAARHFGPGLIAEDLPEALPGVLRGLGA